MFLSYFFSNLIELIADCVKKFDDLFKMTDYLQDCPHECDTVSFDLLKDEIENKWNPKLLNYLNNTWNVTESNHPNLTSQ